MSQVPMVPVLLDAIIPLNESRKKLLLVRAKFPIDPDEHHLLIQLYFAYPIVGALFIIASTDSVAVAVNYHFVGLISVVKLVSTFNELTIRIISHVKRICKQFKSSQVSVVSSNFES